LIVLKAISLSGLHERCQIGTEYRKSAEYRPCNDRTSDRLCFSSGIERVAGIQNRVIVCGRWFSGGCSFESAFVVDADCENESGCGWIPIADFSPIRLETTADVRGFASLSFVWLMIEDG
jgi:hypothetical protein